MDLIRKLQADKQFFDDYRESIYKIRNKEYLERYNNTVCLIEQDYDHEDDFVIQRNSDPDPDSDTMDIDIPEKQINNMNNLCLISDS